MSFSWLSSEISYAQFFYKVNHVWNIGSLELMYAVAAVNLLVDFRLKCFQSFGCQLLCFREWKTVCVYFLTVYVKLVPVFSSKQITKESHYIVCILCHAWEQSGVEKFQEKNTKKQETEKRRKKETH